VSANPEKPRDRIFISYRRDDSRGASGRVWDWLRIGFGRERVFRDVASIGAGKWRQKIDQAMAASAVCVAVIGRRWADSANLPRLRDPNDMVRHELEAALERGDRDELTVIPLLVEDAQLSAMAPEQLPESLRPLLADWNVLVLTESGWDDDTRRLIEAITETAGLPVNPELRDWLALMAGAQRGLATARSAKSLAGEERSGEEPALDGLLRRAAEAEPSERPALKAALAALATGNTRLAEASFEEELASSQRRRQLAEELAVAERRREADAARNVASLAMVRGDLPKAVRHLLIALAADPEDLEAALELGHAWIRQGDLAQAEGVFTALIQRAQQRGDQRQEGRARRGRGDVLALRGDAKGATAAYEEARTLALTLSQREPEHALWQRDLAISHHKVGDGWIALGNASAALTAYQEGLAISEALAGLDPANSLWQHDLSVSLDRVGQGWKARGDGAAALASFQASLRIREALCQADPDNTSWQRDLSVSQEQVGDGLMARGDGFGAMAAYQASLGIRDALARHDPANSQWQRDLSVSHDRIGNGWMAQGEAAAALAAYESGLRIRESLARRDPTHTQWQRDRFVSQIKIGDGRMALEDSAGALAAYQASLPIAEELSRRDPANLQALRDCYVSRIKIGDGLMVQGDGAGALQAYEESLRIADELVSRDPSRGEWQIDRAASCARLGSLDMLLPVPSRREHLCRGRDILLALKETDRLEASKDWSDWFAKALRELDDSAAS
jgi:tetratricopeptide (TPR) repeat protein